MGGELSEWGKLSGAEDSSSNTKARPPYLMYELVAHDKQVIAVVHRGTQPHLLLLVSLALHRLLHLGHKLGTEKRGKE